MQKQALGKKTRSLLKIENTSLNLTCIQKREWGLTPGVRKSYHTAGLAQKVFALAKY